MDEKLHQWVVKEATKQGRTVTNYIEWILSQHRLSTVQSKKS